MSGKVFHSGHPDLSPFAVVLHRVATGANVVSDGFSRDINISLSIKSDRGGSVPSADRAVVTGRPGLLERLAGKPECSRQDDRRNNLVSAHRCPPFISSARRQQKGKRPTSLLLPE